MEPSTLLVRWIVYFGVLFLAAVPIARLLFPSAPDRGAGLAVPIAMVIVTLLAYYLGHWRFGPATALASVAGLAVLGAGAEAVNRRREAANRSRGAGGYDRKRVAGAFVAFLAGFLLVAGFRAMGPTLTPVAGEQYLHTGLYHAVVRAESLPPEDMWYAGEPVRYYFALPVFNAVGGLLTATPTVYVHNLALAGYFGALVSATYSLCAWISHDRGLPRRLGGVLGVFFVAFAGNLATATRFGFGLLPEDLALAYGEPVFGAIGHREYEEAVASQSSRAEWQWFFARDIVPGTLQEFPLYSFVKADMHGHTVTIPMLVLAAALAYAYVRAPASARRRRWGLLFGGMALVGGYFGLANTWSMPTVVGLAWLALAFAGPHPVTLLPPGLVGRVRSVISPDSGSDTDATNHAPDGGGFRAPGLLGRACSECWRVLSATLVAVGVGVAAVVVAAPFVLGGMPTNDGIGLFPPRTHAVGGLLVYGGFIALFAAFLAFTHRPLAQWRTRDAVGAGLLATGWLALAWLAGDFGTVLLVGPLVLAGWVTLRRFDTGFETVLLVGGVGLVVAMELVHAKVYPHHLPRWNTTLKVAIQAWVVCGLAAGPIAAALVVEMAPVSRLWRVLARIRHASMSDGRADGNDPVPAVVSVAVLVLLVGVVAGTSMFGLLVVSDHLAGPMSNGGYERATFDGLDYHQSHNPEKVEAIEWLDANASDRGGPLWMERSTGSPTIVEAPGEHAYQRVNFASTFTGLPSVAGWEHQEGYRGEDAYQTRVNDVDRGMTSEGAFDHLVEAYGVEYIYVGPSERDRYGEDLLDFEAQPGVELAFENEEVRIYVVDGSELG